MSDGRITIDVEIDDTGAIKGVSDLEKKLDSVGESGQQAGDGIKEIANSLDLIKIASSSIDAFKKALDGAVSRLDAMNQFPQVMDAINESTEASKVAMGALTGTVDNLSKELDGAVGKEVLNDTNKLSDNLNKVSDSGKKAGTGIKELATSLGLVKIASKAIDLLRNALDGAITRFDTMNQFPRVMEAVGFGAEESSKAIERLTAGIQGLPTRLDEVVGTAQRLGMMTKDLRLATDLTLSLNNAFLASGSSADTAGRGLEQYLQMLSTGKVDMQSWKILQETMGVALNQIAESFGMSVSDLYNALQTGSITFDEFNRRIIELNDGVGGFAEVALKGSEGIRTSFANIATAIVNGVEKAIRAVDDLLESVTGKNIAQSLDIIKVLINTAFRAIVDGIKNTEPIVRGVISIFNALINVFKALDVVIIGLLASWGAFKILTQIAGWFGTLNAAVNTLKTSQLAYLSVSQLLTAHQVTATSVQKILALGYGLLTSATVRASVATKAFGIATTFLSGPVGWAVVAIGALTAGALALWKAFGKAGPAVEEMNSNLQKAVDDTKALNDQTEASADAYEKTISSIESQRTSMTKLMEDTVALSKKQNLTAGEQKLMKDNIDALNESITGLNVSYGKESEALTVSQVAMQARIDLIAEEAKLTASRERMIEIESEMSEVMLQQEVNARLLATAQKELDDAGFNWFGRNNELKDSVAALTDENATLEEQLTSLATEAEITAEIQAEAAERAAQAQAIAIAQGITSIDQLTDKQKELVESAQASYQAYADAATNAFEKIDMTAKASIDEMIANSRHNKEAMITMAEDAAVLRTRFDELGLDQTIIDQFIAMGAEGPGLVGELATATDEQLATLVSNTDAKSTDLKEAFMKMFDIDQEEFVEGFGSLVTSMEETLSTQLENSDLKKSVLDALTSDTESIAQAGKTVGTEIATGLGGAGAEMESAGADLITSATTGMSGNTEAVMSVVNDMMAQLTEITASGATEMDSVMASGMNAVQSTVEAGFNSVLAVIQSTLGQAVNVAQSTSNGVVSALRGAVGGATQAGRDTGAGFRNGIESQRGSIMATARSIADAATSAMRATLKTASPSKVTTEIGEDTGEGYVVGMENKFKRIQQTAKQLSMFGIPSLGTTSHLHNVSNSNAVYNNNTYNQPTPEPINQQTGTGKVDTYTIVFDDGTFAGKLVPTISKIMGDTVKDIERGW